jgi:hypothetical protein
LLFYYHYPLSISRQARQVRDRFKQNASWTKHIPFRKVDIRDTYIHFLSSSSRLSTVFAETKLTKRCLGSSQDSNNTHPLTHPQSSLWTSDPIRLEAWPAITSHDVTRTSRGNADKIICIHCGATATSALHLILLSKSRETSSFIVLVCTHQIWLHTKSHLLSQVLRTTTRLVV